MDVNTTAGKVSRPRKTTDPPAQPEWLPQLALGPPPESGVS